MISPELLAIHTQEALSRELPTLLLEVVESLKNKRLHLVVMEIITVAVVAAIIIMVAVVTTKPIKRQKIFLKLLMRSKSKSIELKGKSKTSTPMRPMYSIVEISAKTLSKMNLLPLTKNWISKEKVKSDTRKRQVVLNYLNLGRRKSEKVKLTLKMLRMRKFGIRYKSIKSGGIHATQFI